MDKLLCIAAGGAVGALLRYGVSGWAYALLGTRLPWGTLAVNLSGSFVIGLLSGVFSQLATPPWLRDLLLIGLLGAFTTFSTFSLETLNLLRDRELLLAGANVTVSCVAGVGLALCGLVLGQAIIGWLR